jgi:hypothetical protein
VETSGRHAPNPNPGHGGHRQWIGVIFVRSTVAYCITLAARKQPAGHIYKQAVRSARRNGRHLPAAALPRATGQISDPRLGTTQPAASAAAHRADGARVGDQLAIRECMLQQRHDHRRLCRQLGRLLPAVATTENLACLGNADQSKQVKVLTHSCQFVQL